MATPPSDLQPADRSAHTALTQLQTGPSPYSPEQFLSLFVDPRYFFSGRLALGKTRYILVAIWIAGISFVIDRIKQEVLRVELGIIPPGWDELGQLIAGTWLGFWLFVTLMGCLGGLLVWMVGGWWFRLRLRWAGAQNPNPHLSRLVFIYASLVFALPNIMVALLWTFFHTSYATAYSEDIFLSLMGLIFAYWELYSAYAGVRVQFTVDRWKARLWFGILPGLLYVIIYLLSLFLLQLVGS